MVTQRLPLAANALNTMFSHLVDDFKNVVTKASSGPFLDPCQHATEMFPRLNHMCAHLRYLGAQLEQLSEVSQNLMGELIRSLFEADEFLCSDTEIFLKIASTLFL